MPKACFCYAIDEGYVLPALISAMMLRRETPDDDADVVVVCFGPVTDLTRRATEACAAEGVVFLTAPASHLRGMPMICARFFLDEILSADYCDVTYLDADTQVLNSLAPLLGCAIPAGGLIAVPDLMALMSDHAGAVWRRHRAYFRSIGIPDSRHASYFNSGVIRFRRADWAGISAECLALCSSPAGQAFRFLDQDALNVVLAGRTALASLKWNFPGFFLGSGLEDYAAPSVVHYMSKPRPWDGPFHPWGKAGAAPYAALISRYPDLALLHRPLSGAKRLRYSGQQLYKRLAYDWGSRDMRARVASFEARAVV